MGPEFQGRRDCLQRVQLNSSGLKASVFSGAWWAAFRGSNFAHRQLDLGVFFQVGVGRAFHCFPLGRVDRFALRLLMRSCQIKSTATAAFDLAKASLRLQPPFP